MIKRTYLTQINYFKLTIKIIEGYDKTVLGQ